MRNSTFLSSTECISPAAAMYVLPMVLIFSTEENLGLDRSCLTHDKEGETTGEEE